MMKRMLAPTVALLLAVAPAFAADGPLQVGDDVGAFYVKDVTGPAAGTALCYRCRFGDQPVVSIFTRNVDDKLAALLKEVDAVVGKNAESKKMAAFLVVLTDDPTAQEEALKKLAKDNGIKNVPLTTFEDLNGPRGYRLSKDAEVTVMMWVDGKVQVNESLSGADLTAEKIAALTKSTSKILN
jgi:hypothetical protein